MTRIKIDANEITNSESFHNIFQEKFGFPEFYGRNMNAWIDCMSYLDDPGSGMSKVHCKKGDYVVIELENIKEFKKRCPEIYDDLIECAAFVNWRILERNENPMLMLSFYG